MEENIKNTELPEEENVPAEEIVPDEDSLDEDDAVSEYNDTANEYADLEDKLAEANDKYVRLFAEYDNYRKRTAREKADTYSNASAKCIDWLRNQPRYQ